MPQPESFKDTFFESPTFGRAVVRGVLLAWNVNKKRRWHGGKHESEPLLARVRIWKTTQNASGTERGFQIADLENPEVLISDEQDFA